MSTAEVRTAIEQLIDHLGVGLRMSGTSHSFALKGGDLVIVDEATALARWTRRGCDGSPLPSIPKHITGGTRRDVIRLSLEIVERLGEPR